jgi:hypothetical protein
MTPEEQLDELVVQIREIYDKYGTDQVVKAIARYRQEQQLIEQEQALTNKVLDFTQQLEKVKKARRTLRKDNLINTEDL